MQILQLPKPAKDLPTNIDWSLVRSEFESLHEQFPPLNGTTILPYDSVITPDANAGASEGQDEGKETDAEQIYAVEMHERLEKAEAYGKRLGVAPAAGVKNPKGQAFVNGRHFYMNDVSVAVVVALFAGDMLTDCDGLPGILVIASRRSDEDDPVLPAAGLYSLFVLILELWY